MMENVIPKGTKVRIPKGTVIWGTFKEGTKEAGRNQTVTVFDSTPKGYEQYGEPYIVWPGTGGYWHNARVEDVEILG